jgi:hypothetical protein
MESEIAAIKKNNTWDLTDLPRDATIVGVKLIYKTKLNEHGEVDKIQGSPCRQRVHVTTLGGLHGGICSCGSHGYYTVGARFSNSKWVVSVSVRCKVCFSSW